MCSIHELVTSIESENSEFISISDTNDKLISFVVMIGKLICCKIEVNCYKFLLDTIKCKNTGKKSEFKELMVLRENGPDDDWNMYCFTN